jgi:DNA-directed RNA polymerase subunit H (RpoH/RPB5)
MATHKKCWHLEVKTLKAAYKEIVQRYLEADPVLKQIFEVLGDIVSLARSTPDTVGDSET